jgi:hypothetical protein
VAFSRRRTKSPKIAFYLQKQAKYSVASDHVIKGNDDNQLWSHRRKFSLADYKKFGTPKYLQGHKCYIGYQNQMIGVIGPHV